jgi:hypothetical protein
MIAGINLHSIGIRRRKGFYFIKKASTRTFRYAFYKLTPLRHKNDYFYPKQRHSPMNLYLNRVIVQTMFT